MLKEKIVGVLNKHAEKCAESYVTFIEMNKYGLKNAATDEAKKEFRDYLNQSLEGDFDLKKPATADKALKNLGVDIEEMRENTSILDRIQFKISYYNDMIFWIIKLVYCMFVIMVIQGKILKNHTYLDICSKSARELMEICNEE